MDSTKQEDNKTFNKVNSINLYNCSKPTNTRMLKMKKELKENMLFYILPIPGLIALIMFSYIPMAGLYIVFEQYSFKGGLFGSKFVGLYNFKFFFDNMEYALRATRNTIVINGLDIIFSTVTAIAIAVMINEISHKWYRKVSQSIMIFPHFVSWIVVGMISFSFFDEKNGILNIMINTLGGNPVSWYTNPWVWWPVIIIVTLWKGAGYSSIIYFCALTGFDQSCYEAADIDGASRWQKIFKITIPLLKPTIIIMFLLSIGSILGGGIDRILGLTNLNPLLLETTDTIATFVYRSAIMNGQFESASAVQLYQSIFGFFLVMFSNWLVKKYDPEYSLF